MKKRTNILRFCLLFAVGVIAVRLFFIQIIQHSEWVAKADAQHTLKNTIMAKRGEIYMMDGDEAVAVVMNETVYTLIVDPMMADEEKTKEVVEEYAKDNLVAKWEDVFKNKTRRYYIVARNVSRASVEKIREEELIGVSFQENTKRVYPEGELASGLLGFVNLDGKGQYGVEGSLNTELAGTNGLLKTVSDVNNIALSIGDNNIKVPAEDGKNIVLTIDRNVQYAVEKALANGMERTGATNASAIVMNPNNGEILAVANLPTYNASEYWNVKDAGSYINYVFDDPIEPASVCKTFTFSAAIDLGAMTPETTYYNAGYTTVDGWKIENAYKGLIGTVSMQTALGWSLNTGSIQALRLMGGDADAINQSGREKLYDYYYNKFGLGQKTGVEIYEANVAIADPNVGNGRDSMYANMTFGQNIQLTMLQVAAAFSSVVNGGEYYTPTIVAGEVKDGEFIEADKKEAVRRTISETTSATMRDMLVKARKVWKNAVDKKGYTVGGKSGTAQAIKNGQYVFDETYATYIGFGSEKGEMPAYVVMVRLWADGKTMNGGNDALPVFTEISDYMIDYLKLKPTE